MERLTKRDTDGQAMMDCQKCKADWTGKHGKPMGDCTALYCRNRLKDRLATYEDSGCASEEVLPKDKADEIALKLMRLADLESFCSYTRLRELAEADKDGRLVVLPVRPVLTQSIGSMLYIIEDGEIVEDSLCEALVGMGSNGEINIFYTTLSDQISFEQADIGKTVFLTREEAEKALEAKK
jgi:hypothetical protein